jgi:hypothetical protein
MSSLKNEAEIFRKKSLVSHANGAMNKFGICYQWRNEHFKPRMLFFSVGSGAMNVMGYWQWRRERPAMFATARWCLKKQKSSTDVQ